MGENKHGRRKELFVDFELWIQTFLIGCVTQLGFPALHPPLQPMKVIRRCWKGDAIAALALNLLVRLKRGKERQEVSREWLEEELGESHEGESC